jgi:hypothetical protein
MGRALIGKRTHRRNHAVQGNTLKPLGLYETKDTSPSDAYPSNSLRHPGLFVKGRKKCWRAFSFPSWGHRHLIEG